MTTSLATIFEAEVQLEAAQARVEELRRRYVQEHVPAEIGGRCDGRRAASGTPCQMEITAIHVGRVQRVTVGAGTPSEHDELRATVHYVGRELKKDGTPGRIEASFLYPVSFVFAIGRPVVFGLRQHGLQWQDYGTQATLRRLGDAAMVAADLDEFESLARQLTQTDKAGRLLDVYRGGHHVAIFDRRNNQQLAVASLAPGVEK